MMKRVVLLATLAATVAAFSAVTPAQAGTPHGGLCQLSGTANFTPGLTAKPNPAGTYTFTGNVTGCQEGSVSTKPAPPGPATTGSVQASGHAVSKGISCEAGLSAGSATITWTSGPYAGKTTSVGFKTYSAGAFTIVSGAVSASGDPNIHVGDKAESLLAFQTSTPQACAQGGLSSAQFQGVSGTGWVK